jgi:hypothetical protein
MGVTVADDDVPEVEHAMELLASGQLWVTESTAEKHVHSILTKPTPPETDGDHRRVLAVVTLLQAR